MKTDIKVHVINLSDGAELPCHAETERIAGSTRLTAELQNTTRQSCKLMLEFFCVVPVNSRANELLSIMPLTANGLMNHHALADVAAPSQLTACEQIISLKEAATPDLVAHYLEPAASHPSEKQTTAPLLIPLVELFERSHSSRFALFTSPERPWRLAGQRVADRHWRWSFQTMVTLSSGQALSESCWLFNNPAGTQAAWSEFHRLAHKDVANSIPEWLREVRVHYFDFLSAGADGRRGFGYDESAARFRKFRVGLATQHGYYPFWGDYVHPDRTHWSAMRSDAKGPAAMSLDLLRQRIAAARQAGGRAGIYLHLVGFDGASPLDQHLRDAVKIDPNGQPTEFAWNGPDVLGPVRFMSISSPGWRKHLLQQAEWIMELLNPDALVIDETFTYVGYDHHPDRPGPTSLAGIAWMKELRALVRSYGTDKAVLTSDCGLGSLALWADGEAGDHAYEQLLGNPFYRQKPIRYLAALNEKPWLPCAWQAWKFWDGQMELAANCGAALGVSNGWLEFTGLAHMPAEQERRMLTDIARYKSQKSLRRDE